MVKITLRLLVFFILSGSAFWSADAQILIKDINPGTNGSTIYPGGIVGNKLFFIAYDSKSSELWVSDREIDSTYMIGPVLPGLDGTPNNESHFLVFKDSLLVFTAYFNSNDVNLYSTNGSLEGTQFIKTLAQGRNIMNELVGFNDKFYFPGYDAAHRTELWESDGSESGTHHLLNTLTGKPARSPINFTNYNNRLWFTSLGQPWYIDDDSLKLADSYYPNTSNYSLQLFAGSDTDPAYFIQPYLFGQPYNILLNKRLVKVNPDASIEVIDTTLKAESNILAYKNQSLIYSEKLNEGLLYIADIKSLNAKTGEISVLTSFSVTNSIGINPGWVDGNDNVFLSINIGGFMELWVTDGSPSGTSKIDFAPGSTGQTVYFIADTENGGYLGASGNIFFNAGINGSDQHLWISDGTDSGTERIEVDGQPIKFSNYGFHHYANGIVFIASHPDYGNEIFYSDGTSAGTKLLADVIPGTNSPFSYTLGIISDTLFLVSTPNTDYGTELYALPIDLCEDVVCPEGFECVYGECLPIDYCAEVVCPEGHVCYEGGCFEGCLDGSCVELGPNLAAGHNATIELDAGFGYDVYEWSTGENEQKIKVKTSGRYWVTAYNLAGGYFGSDTLSVIFECDPQGLCPEGFECIDGYCINTDPCADVSCPEGEVCFQGAVFPAVLITAHQICAFLVRSLLLLPVRMYRVRKVMSAMKVDVFLMPVQM